MLRLTINAIIFAAALGIGIFVASEGRQSLKNAKPTHVVPNVPDHFELFSAPKAASPPQIDETAPWLEKKTHCRDPKILPFWNALLRDKASREVIEYSTDVIDCKDILEIKHIDLNGDGQSEVLIRAVTIPSCGAVGNCDFWILEKVNGRYRILLHGDDYWDASQMGEQVLRKRTKGYRDILLKGHFSASDTSYSTYKYNGKRYVEKGCRYKVPDYLNSDDKRTKWKFVSCEEYYRSLDSGVR